MVGGGGWKAGQRRTRCRRWRCTGEFFHMIVFSHRFSIELHAFFPWEFFWGGEGGRKNFVRLRMNLLFDGCILPNVFSPYAEV